MYFCVIFQGRYFFRLYKQKIPFELMTSVPSIVWLVVSDYTYLKLGAMFYEIVIPVSKKSDGLQLDQKCLLQFVMFNSLVSCSQKWLILQPLISLTLCIDSITTYIWKQICIFSTTVERFDMSNVTCFSLKVA